ncbi:MAG: AAA family ATPase [Paraclostridium sp.]
MDKCFNTTGICVPNINYMVNIDNKLNNIEKLIDKGNYFVINRPRQYGKTTTMYLLEERLKERYIVISISFEGLGDSIFKTEEYFSSNILNIFADSLEFIDEKLSNEMIQLGREVKDLRQVSKAISKFIKNSEKEVILFVDEVDKSSNNQLFLSFLGMLRNKYLLSKQRKDYTFKSIILAGVHDIKNLKLKLRDSEEIKYNSPWNIAINFDVDMSFSKDEIKTMIEEYSIEHKLDIDVNKISEDIQYYTSGYPFLVSRICQIIDENILDYEKRVWIEEDIKLAIKIMLKERNTLFDDLIKNIENNSELYNLIYNIVLDGNIITFNISNPIIDLGYTYGIFKEVEGIVKLNNRIYEQYIYDYLTSKVEIKNTEMSLYNFKSKFVENGKLNMRSVLEKFQQFMKEQYSNIDAKFIEREGRLLFLAFIKPIINGVGFDFKEVQISEEKRLDVVINYNKEKYIVELKIWRGDKYHERGIEQLVDYLDIHGLDSGYMVVYNFNKNKEYKNEVINIKGKEIYITYV